MHPRRLTTRASRVCAFHVCYDEADDGESVRQGGLARGQSEGVHVPQVHAFNVLRAAFQDKELSTETTSFAAQGLEVSIRAFSSPHWEVSQPSDGDGERWHKRVFSTRLRMLERKKEGRHFFVFERRQFLFFRFAGSLVQFFLTSHVRREGMGGRGRVVILDWIFDWTRTTLKYRYLHL